jgi:hypothetical protein
MLLLVQSYALDEAPYKLSGAVAKLACINLLKFASFSYWFDKPWFHTEGRLAAVLITPSLGVSNWAVIYKNSYINTAQPTSFLAPLPGRKKISARGVSRFQSFTLLLFCFIFACILLSKIQKN